LDIVASPFDGEWRNRGAGEEIELRADEGF
jgi:hypothetical protein